MIDVLMRKGNAYRAADGSVYFKISSFPGYGALSRIKERELKVTNSVVRRGPQGRRWGTSRSGRPTSPRRTATSGGRARPAPREGRPGWHIECSAMIKRHLGETIDLHTGGVDLLFPHHENEIAQSQCCNGATFARHWYHTEHLLVDGTTMSKSKGNYYTLGDLVAKGYSPDGRALRAPLGPSPQAAQLHARLPACSRQRAEGPGRFSEALSQRPRRPAEARRSL